MDHHSKDPTVSMYSTNSTDYLQSGITTRVMAKRLLRRSIDASESPDGQRSRFLSGTLVPNSTIQSISKSGGNKVAISSSSSIHSAGSNKSTGLESTPSEDDPETRRKMSEQRGLERMRKKFRRGSQDASQKSNQSSTSVTSAEARESRRASQRLLMEDMPDFSNRRRSTLQSLHEAINKSPPNGQKLINADSIDHSGTSSRRRSSNVSKKLQFAEFADEPDDE